MKCPRCQRDIDDRASFCGYCGMVIAPPPQAPQAGPVPAEGKQQAAKKDREEAKRIREEAKRNRREAKKSRRAAPPQMVPPNGAAPQMVPPNGAAPQMVPPNGAAPQMVPPNGAAPQMVPPNGVPPQEAPPKKKKRVGLIALLICSVLAVAAGSTLGFMSVRGIIDWKRLIPSRQFAWTDASEGVTAQVVSLDAPDDSDDSKDKPAMADPEETLDPEETPAPQDPENPENPENPEDPSESQPGSDDPESGPGDPPGEDDPPGETEEPEGLHYLKDTESTLLIVDDMARVLPEESILEIMDKMRDLSDLSNYSVMVVFTDSLPGVSLEEAARAYFTDAMASIREDLPLSMDGFILLADLADGEFCLSAFGAAENQLTDERIDAILEDIGPYTEADGPAAAVLDILETLLTDLL